ncbi:MAG: hypothetical protein HY903_10025 [Deltaproteobacteria bacterium]|nr:hypothetical protein [Deltaproteobacteria bacterium]
MKLLPAVALVVVAAGAPAAATTVRSYTEREMTAAAVSIVRGKVVEVRSRLHPSGLIVTDVSIRVERLLKADVLSEVVVFTQLGGVLHERRLTVPGTSVYAVGDAVLLFLEQGGEGLVELGVGAGKYQIYEAGGQTLVRRQLAGVAFAAVTKGPTTRALPPPVTPEPLALFEARIASYLGE